MEFLEQYSLTILFTGLGIIFLTGRGLFLINGYNSLPPRDKEKWNEKALSRAMAALCFVLAISNVIINISDFYSMYELSNILYRVLSFLTLGVIFFIFTSSRFKKK